MTVATIVAACCHHVEHAHGAEVMKPLPRR